MMSGLPVDKRRLGVTFNNRGEAEITVWSPLAEKIEVQLLAAKSTLALQKDEYGYWRTTTSQLQPGDLYKLVVNNGKDLPDPASLSQPQGVHGPSAAVDTGRFAWTDNDWNNISLKQYIFYELHTGTFTPQGTFSGIEEKLDYIKSLGVTAIELMPIAQFPGDRNWGYDGVYPFAVQHSYGGAAGLQHLVNACHQKGLAVVLDVVYNHLGPEGNYLDSFAPYFTAKYHTPWGNAINFDDAYCDGVRHYYIENALMWFRDFHIDALRLDAVHAIKDFSPTHILKALRQHVDELRRQTGRQHYLVAELDLNDTRYITPEKEGGYGMDAQWIDEFHHALRVTAGEPRTGYYSDFDGIHHLAKAYSDAYVYTGNYSPHRKKMFGTDATDFPGQQFVVFSQNHDQIGNRMLGERTSQLVSFEMQKLMAAAVVLSPYLPLLFMGEEWGEPHPFLYFVSHTDPELIEAVRKGRKAEFAAFHAEGEAPDPVQEATFQQSKLQWDLVHEGTYNKLFRYYQALIQLRKQQPALSHLNRQQVKVITNEEAQTIFLHRWQQEQHVIAVLHFSKKAQSLSLPGEQPHWQKIWDSADPVWSGPAAAPDTVHQQEVVTLQPESVVVYATTVGS